jgi:hypothetical protein
MFNTIPIEIPMTFITDRKIYPKVHVKTQKTTNSQGNTDQKEQRWRYHNTRLPTILHGTGTKTDMKMSGKE